VGAHESQAPSGRGAAGRAAAMARKEQSARWSRKLAGLVLVAPSLRQLASTGCRAGGHWCGTGVKKTVKPNLCVVQTHEESRKQDRQMN